VEKPPLKAEADVKKLYEEAGVLESDKQTLRLDLFLRILKRYEKEKPSISRSNRERRVRMTEQAKIEEYNYSGFVGSEQFMAFRTHLPVGSSAPDFKATLLETKQTVRLSEYWKKSDVLIEFGSLT